MASGSTVRRVAIGRRLYSDISYELVLGILDYSEHVRHWRFVGPEVQPFLTETELSLSDVDGVIGMFWEQSEADRFTQAGVAAVNVSNVRAEVRLPRVSPDDEAIGRLGAAHLLERGFTRFGFVSEKGYWFGERRCAGFEAAIERDARRELYKFTCAWSAPAHARAQIRGWLESLPRPIAVMASNDQLAGHTIAAAGALGLRVPDDVAVLGVDNNRWMTSMASTPISSIEPDGRQTGYRAAKLLDALMSSQPAPAPQWVLPLGVVTRRSTDIRIAEDALVSRALRFIRDHCTEGISVEDVLDVVQISRRSFEYRLKRATGLTPRAAITQAQIAWAKKLLLQSDQTAGQIGEAAGFQRQDGFSVIFKRVTGLTPGQYRQQNRPPARRSALTTDAPGLGHDPRSEAAPDEE